MDRNELDRRLKALGYALETDEQRGAEGEIREMTWRRLVRVDKVTTTQLVPVKLIVGGHEKVLFDREETTVETPVTRSLYIVDSKDGLEIYNGGKRYTLDEIEAEEQAEKEGNPLPPKVQLIT